MTRPYSEDLRERALARSEAGETDRTIAQALSIAPSCLSKWRKLRRETGALRPGKQQHDDREIVWDQRDPEHQAEIAITQLHQEDGGQGTDNKAGNRERQAQTKSRPTNFQSGEVG